MSLTVLVEPDPSGHRFQAVANVADVAGRTDEVLLLTSHGARQDPAFTSYLEGRTFGGRDLEVIETFDEVYPPTLQVARTLARLCRERDVATVVVMDADQALKRWWYAAPRAFGRSRRPRVVFMLTRYPAKLQLTDWVGQKLRVPKATLAAAAMATGSLDRVAGFSGRDDLSAGWLVKRTRDPDICLAHSRDRAALRAKHGLAPDRVIAGIYGGISERKNSALIWEALKVEGIEADLLLGGSLTPEVRAWVEALPAAEREHVIVRDGFLSNEELDELVACADVVPIALTNNGPSGIMGKALAADVPVVTAGSLVRAKELISTDGGEVADLDAASIGAAIRRVLERDPDRPRRSTVPPCTPEDFSRRLLGVDEAGRVTGGRRARRRARGTLSRGR